MSIDPLTDMKVLATHGPYRVIHLPALETSAVTHGNICDYMAQVALSLELIGLTLVYAQPPAVLALSPARFVVRVIDEPRHRPSVFLEPR